ncbi:MAG TPA: DUF2071 domain-containing protein [Gaiellaceae bacterium]|nr:DUF2071 domain-containing protein [Gaiellaceae bacterium]
MPGTDWLQAQTWERLLFAHWRLPAEVLRTHVPEQLPLDTFEDSAWLGITPFRLSGLRLRGLPPLPVISSFPEVNVRTYVTLDERPGIFFFSLDAASRPAVEAARLVYKLPYYLARMSAERAAGATEYASERKDERGHRAVFRGRYAPIGEPSAAEPGSREYFLTERYCLYTVHENVVHRAEIHHPPWPLQSAEATIAENTMPPPGIELEGAPVLHYSERQDVVIWGLEPL